MIIIIVIIIIIIVIIIIINLDDCVDESSMSASANISVKPRHC